MNEPRWVQPNLDRLWSAVQELQMKIEVLEGIVVRTQAQLRALERMRPFSRFGVDDQNDPRFE